MEADGPPSQSHQISTEPQPPILERLPQNPLLPILRGPMGPQGKIGVAQWATWFLDAMTPPDMAPVGTLPERLAQDLSGNFPPGRKWATYALSASGLNVIIGDGRLLWKSARVELLHPLHERLCESATDPDRPSQLPDPRSWGIKREESCAWINVLAHEFATLKVYFWPARYAFERVRLENGLPPRGRTPRSLSS